MSNRRLTHGTRVHVRTILITEAFGNMRITDLRRPANIITIERADIGDFVTALKRHLAEGVPAGEGSIWITQASCGSLWLQTTHTPSNNLLIERGDIDDLTTAIDEALGHLEDLP